ncbi:hypothetical protein [Desulfobacula sp.]|uniref:hypothetical protein n=1 Tax=Desulfobacula sp. TaxID=2593537 RepID=UPI0026056885|nr:hypothetical protein [Desulfobacula sp.]
MSFKRFIEFFPEIAEKETRRIILRNDPKIPDGEYAFVDSFCEDKDCDCRRVYFDVLQIDPEYEPIHAARISYGWESLDFYLSWSPYLPSKMAAEMKGPTLQPSQKKTLYGEQFIELFESILLVDPAYIDRIKRHYTLFKAKLGGKAIKKIYKEYDIYSPCPCGSGKK